MAARKTKPGRGGKRAGAGRPPTLKDARSVTLFVEGPDFEALEEIAEERGVSVASLIREAVSAHLRRLRRK